jgi:hypothetical protein
MQAGRQPIKVIWLTITDARTAGAGRMMAVGPVFRSPRQLGILPGMSTRPRSPADGGSHVQIQPLRPRFSQYLRFDCHTLRHTLA